MHEVPTLARRKWLRERAPGVHYEKVLTHHASTSSGFCGDIIAICWQVGL